MDHLGEYMKICNGGCGLKDLNEKMGSIGVYLLIKTCT